MRATAAAFTILLSGAVFAGQDEDVMAGFDDFEVEPTGKGPRPITGQVYVSGGFNDSLAAAWLDPYEGFSKLQTGIRLKLDLRPGAWRIQAEARSFFDWIYRDRGRENFTAAAVGSYERETEWQEAYLLGPLGEHITLKTGRQVLAWGRSDNIRVLDQLNPLDLREPGSTDIEEIRLPVHMTRVDYARKALTLSLVAIHELRFHKLPVPGSLFAAAPAGPPTHEEIPSDRFAAEHAISLTGVYSGWDFSLHHARLYDDLPYAVPEPGAVRLIHPRIELSGFAVNVVRGNWLWKTEAAHTTGLVATGGADGFSRTDLMLGLEYGGYAYSQVGLELSHHRLGALTGPGGADDSYQLAFRAQRSFANDKFQLVAVALFERQDSNTGRVGRLLLEYRPRDAIAYSAGVLLYGGDRDTRSGQLSDRDRVLIGIKWYF